MKETGRKQQLGGRGIKLRHEDFIGPVWYNGCGGVLVRT